MIRGSGGSKRLAKAASAETCGQSRYKKWYAALARSTFSSQNVQTTACAGDFLKLRCRKIALRCGEKHISKSNKTPLFWCIFGGFYVAKESDRRDRQIDAQ